MNAPSEVFVLTMSLAYEGPEIIMIFATLEGAKAWPFTSEEYGADLDADFRWWEDHGMWFGQEYPDAPRMWSVSRRTVLP